MPNDWIDVTIIADVDAGELLSMLDDPAATGAWQDDGVIHVYWPADRWTSETLLALKQALSSLGSEEAITVGRLPGQDWNAEWARSVKPLRVGRRFVIRPSWEEVALGPGEIELVIDPKQAFGTGHHATTQLLIEWLEEVVNGGETVLDVGTGSGILAMTALRLGAARALGIDSDPVAIDCAREYAVVNGFGVEMDLRTATLEELREPEPRGFDLVLANLDRGTLVESAALLTRCLARGARLFVSGLLAVQKDKVAGAFAAVGAYVQEQREREGWLALEMLVAESCESTCPSDQRF